MSHESIDCPKHTMEDSLDCENQTHGIAHDTISLFELWGNVSSRPHLEHAQSRGGIRWMTTFNGCVITLAKWGSEDWRTAVRSVVTSAGVLSHLMQPT